VALLVTAAWMERHPDPAAPTRPDAAPLAPAGSLVFDPFDRGLPATGQWRNGFDLADLNGDGHLDLVHGPPRKGRGTPVVFLGDGKGGWTRWAEAQFPPAPYDYGDAAAADFNGDRVVDVAFGIHLRGLLVLVGDGRGGFRPWSEGIELGPPAFSSRTIEALDWDGDGRPDLAALGEGPHPPAVGAVVYRNRDDGTWEKRAEEPGKSYAFGEALAPGDFNGDGRPDLLLGTSVLGDRQILRLGRPDGLWDAALVEAVPPRGILRAAAAADLDRDGRDELLLGGLHWEKEAWSTSIEALHASASGGWDRRTVAAEPGRESIYALGTGDLDGDRIPDLAALTGDGRVWLFRGDGKGGLTRLEAPEIEAAGAGCRGYHVELADLDGDGAAEIVAAFAGEPSAYSLAPECPNGGSIRAWKARPAAGEATGSRAEAEP
jgi:hypothetical protein